MPSSLIVHVPVAAWPPAGVAVSVKVSLLSTTESLTTGVRTSIEFLPDGSGAVPVGPGVVTLFRELTKAQPAIVQLADLDAPPHAYVQDRPAPDWVPADKAHGRVVIDYFIDPEGDVLIPSVVSTPNPELGAFAAQLVQGWVFAPPQKGGKPITAHATVSLDF